ncbi:dienelactone hydrolase family protein [Novosphingobium lentum]|uniref:dienelactone hydrolase family protein n=1 Tax=Novosphingobium lentum TaxID=145287 RepID=UPI00083517CE|nr:dienelactone hydrolase family protein [Novosphingobium lentum]
MTLETVPYTHGATALTGRLATPPGTPRGAVVVFPNIANHSPAFDRRATMLAEASYVAMVADFYGTHPGDSMEEIFAVAGALRADVDHYRARLAAGVAALRDHPAAAGLPMAAIGFCMGGQAVLELARHGADLAVVASFHGLLDSDRPATAATPIATRILVCHGDKDPMVPRTQVAAFEEEMDAAGADWHLHVYARAKHGFTDPASDSRGMPAIAYDASADRQSWAALLSLFDEVFD